MKEEVVECSASNDIGTVNAVECPHELRVNRRFAGSIGWNAIAHETGSGGTKGRGHDELPDLAWWGQTIGQLAEEHALADQRVHETTTDARIGRRIECRWGTGVTHRVGVGIVGEADAVGASEGTKEWHRVEEAERSAKVGEAIADKDMTDANTQTLCIAGVTCIRIAEKKPDTGELNPEEE